MKANLLKYILLFFLSLMKLNDTARILIVFPAPSTSSQSVIRPLVQELVKRHQVVLITSEHYHKLPAFEKEANSKNLTKIVLKLEGNNMCEKTISPSKDNGFAEAVQVLEEQMEMFEKVLQTDVAVAKFLESQSDFDLMILDADIRPLLFLSHKYKATVILMSSNGGTNQLYDIIGASTHPILHHTKLDRRINNLSKWDKFVRIFEYFRWMCEWKILEYKENKMLRRNFGPDMPSISALSDNVDLLFLNTHPVWDGYRPFPPALVYLWGIHLQSKKTLSKDLSHYIGSSKHGVIYMSLGMTVKSCMIPQKWIDIFGRVFSELPYNILIQWDEDDLPGKPENVRIEKWIAQADVLRHPNVKLFITEGGVQSTDEAIQAGVPLLGIPLLSDQWYQTAKYEQFQIGIQLDPTLLTEENFRVAVETLMSNDSYRRSMIKLRSQMLDYPGMRGVDLALWWIEYVLRHKGATYIRAPVANMSLFQFLELKLVFFVGLGLIILVFVFVLIVRLVIKFIKFLRKCLWSKVKLN